MKSWISALAMALLLAADLNAAHKTCGTIKIDRSTCNVYNGASTSSTVAGEAEQDDELELLSGKSHNGFAKVLYKGKVCFVMASQVQADVTDYADDDEDDDDGVVKRDDLNKHKDKVKRKTPTPAPKKQPTAKATPTKTKTAVGKATPTVRKTRGDDDDDDEREHRTKTVEATRVPTQRPTATEEPEEDTPVPTRRPTLAPTAIPTEIPEDTPVPTRRPTLVPTEVPEEDTPVPTRRPTLVPTAIPTEIPEDTPVPTRRPTPVPTEVPEEDTPVPTRRPTLVPTEVPEEKTPVPNRWPTPVPSEVQEQEVPTRRPTDAPTAYPTRVPTRYATAIPTPYPTAYPTRRATAYVWPTAYPTPVPTPWGQKRARGRAIEQQVQTQTRQNTTYGTRQQQQRRASNFSSSSYAGGYSFSRKAGDSLHAGIYLPLGMGKPYEVKPAFKPDAADMDVRNIGSSGFVGLGFEGRALPWLRFYGDWTAYVHDTKAADEFKLAPAVDVPSVTALLSDTDVHYRMSTHGFRVGAKASLPMGFFEPWVGGGAGLYAWHAEYLDSARSVTYGEDNGLAFGLTGQLGIDFNIDMGGMVLVLTPFGEIGAPVVNPNIRDIAGTGGDWHDGWGTAVMVPRRLGLQIGLSW